MTVLSEGQVEEVDGAAVELLERTGFRVRHEGLLKLTRDAGARVDDADGLVRLPRPLLHELLGQVPPRYVIRNILGGAFEIGGGEACVLAITNDPWVVDYETGMPRHPCLNDVRVHTIAAQCLDAVACMSCMDYPVAEHDDAASSWRALEVHLLHHAKHYVVLPVSPERFREWLAIAKVLNRGDPLADSALVTCGVALVSPLTLTEPNSELLFDACAHGCVVLPTICPMAGATSPYSLASTLLLAHAENLLMAAMTQIVRPGNPFQYALGPSVIDMRSAHDRYYTLDKVLWKVAGVQLAKARGLPCMAECGGSMTHRCDVQSGAEGMLFMRAAYDSGADVLAGLGSCYNANGISAEMMVIQEAWLGAARFLSKGIDCSGARLGVESLARGGPGGEFLTDPLTLELCRGGEFFEHALFDYDGGRPMLERAHECVEELVEGYETPVPEDIGESLRGHFRDLYGRVGG